MGKLSRARSGPQGFWGKERRRAARFQVCQDTLLYNQDSFAEILDISSRGLACKSYVGMANGSEVISGLELLNCEIGLNVRGVSCRRVRDRMTTPDDRHVQPEQVICYYEFVSLDSKQTRELTNFIECCAREPRPEVVFG